MSEDIDDLKEECEEAWGAMASSAYEWACKYQDTMMALANKGCPESLMFCMAVNRWVTMAGRLETASNRMEFENIIAAESKTRAFPTWPEGELPDPDGSNTLPLPPGPWSGDDEKGDADV